MQRTHRPRAAAARDSIAPLVMTIVLAGLFSGSTCVVAYSSCTCDPCFQPCACNELCNQTQSVDFEAARTLTTYELAVVVEPDARTTRIYSQIGGISIARALGTSEYGAEDVRAFVASMIAVNREIMELPDGNARWEFESLDLFETAHVVTFRAVGSSRDAARSLTFLFDPLGNLLEIDENFATR